MCIICDPDLSIMLKINIVLIFLFCPSYKLKIYVCCVCILYYIKKYFFIENATNIV